MAIQIETIAKAKHFFENLPGVPGASICFSLAGTSTVFGIEGDLIIDGLDFVSVINCEFPAHYPNNMVCQRF